MKVGQLITSQLELLNMIKKLFFLLIAIYSTEAQNLNLNEDNIIDKLRDLEILNKTHISNNFNQRPFESDIFNKNKLFFNEKKYSKLLVSLVKSNIQIKLLPINFNIEYNSKYPIPTNNGSMIPNSGYQHIISPGFFIKLGPIDVQLKPEHHYSQNNLYQGFWDNHSSSRWAKRYILWNMIDLPERFGNKRHNNFFLGQSRVMLNYKNLSFGFSNENIWWGPSRINSIMMSNNPRGFKHISFNSNRPLNTSIGDFEFQIISGRLESSGYLPSGNDKIHAGTPIYFVKANQLGKTDDWRYLQAINFNFSPSFLNGLSLGFIRWVQFYNDLVDGYFWMSGKTSYFPIFNNLFRKNDKNFSREIQTDQAAGIYFKYLDTKSNFEIYSEYYLNDSKVNLRDFFVDSRHARAFSLGIQKGLNSIQNNFIISWEWTKLEQTAGRVIRDAGSWYQHGAVKDGYTNRGETLGASIGPGSNSHTFQIKKINDLNFDRYIFSFQIIDRDNDFYYLAFDNSDDFRRYWKDFNFSLEVDKSLKKLNLNSSLTYTKSLNYQWGLIKDNNPSYYQPGIDRTNLSFMLSIIYFPF